MGFAVPAGVELAGAIDGAVGYSNTAGVSGEVSIHDAVAKLPNIAPISAAAADLKILPNALHLEPTALQATGGGTLQVGGDYAWPNQRLVTSITMNGVSIETLKKTAQAWFGAPPALAAFGEGSVTGELDYDNGGAPTPNAPPATPGGWSGQFQFADATLTASGVDTPLTHAQGRASFTPASFDLARFSATLWQHTVQGSYHYNLAVKRQERIHLDLAAADLKPLAAALEPAWREPGLLARLPFAKRSVPAWMSARNLEGDIAVAQLSVNQSIVGPLTARFVWQGVNLQLSNLRIRLPEGDIKGAGTVNLAAREPNARFKGTLSGYRWGGGTVDAEGEVQSSGAGADSLRNLRASGAFWGADVSLSPNDNFDKVSGAFDLSFAGDRPKLHLSKLQAVQRNDDWSGEATSNSDGQLIFDLGNGDRQLHIVSAIAPAQPLTPQPALTSETVAHE
jgi:hypothetical protein